MKWRYIVKGTPSGKNVLLRVSGQLIRNQQVSGIHTLGPCCHAVRYSHVDTGPCGTVVLIETQPVEACI